MEKKQGGCHCGKVRYDVEIDLAQAVIECNCSHCQGKGMLLSAVSGDSLKILSGEDNLTEYRFNTEKIAHTFCKTCGFQCFATAETENGPGAMVNVRTIDDVDIASLTRMPFDGRSR